MISSIGQVFSRANQAISNALGLHRSKAKSLFEKALFANGLALPRSSKILSGLTMGNSYVVSDYTSLYRAFQDLAVIIWDAFPRTPFSFLKEFLSSKDIALGYHAFGTASSLNTVIGLAQMKHAYDSCAYAKSIGDDTGILRGRLSMLKGGLFFGAGASFAFYRPLSIYGVVREFPYQSLIGRLRSISVRAGLAFYALFYALSIGMIGSQMHEKRSFLKQLDRVKDLPSQVAFLQNMLHVDRAELHQKLIEEHGTAKAADLLISEAISSGKENLRLMMKEMDIPKVQEGKLEEIVRKAAVNEKKLMRVGLSMCVQKKQLKQSAKMQRILAKAGVDAMREIASLKGRVTKTDARAQKLVDQVRASAISGIIESSLLLGVSALGGMAMTASIVFTSGAPFVISSALMLVFSIVMAVVDMHYLLLSYQEERPAPHDKKMMALNTAVAIGSLLTLVTLGVSGAVSMGIFPMVVASILSVLWLGQNGVTWMVINRNEKRHQISNPLGDMQVARRAEEAKAKRLELLREALIP